MKKISTTEVHKIEITEQERLLIIHALDKLFAEMTKDHSMFVDVKKLLADFKVFQS